MAVKLEFVGHACFRLWEDNRPSIVMDPYGQTACGLVDDGFRLATDTVIVSSLRDAAHSNVELVTGAKQVINALDIAEVTTPVTSAQRVDLGDPVSIDGVLSTRNAGVGQSRI